MYESSCSKSKSKSASSTTESSAAAEERRDQFFADFYRLKQKYDTSIRGQPEAAKIPLCVNCGKPGGTLFSTKNGHFLAICRATGKKCDLHMELHRGNYFVTPDLILKYKEIVENARENIIVLKNNIEFGYEATTQSKAAFDEENAHYESAKKRLEALCASLGDVEREAERREIMRELADLRRQADSRRQSNEAGNEEDTIDYIQHYLDKVMPLVKRLRDLRDTQMIPYMENVEGGFRVPLTRL
jgi:hypothetical protein